MTDARLDALLEIFRNETAYRSRDAGALRARVLQKLDVRRRRARPLPWLIPVFALLCGAGALAATSGRRAASFAEVVSWLRPTVSAPSTRASGRTPDTDSHPTPRDAQPAVTSDERSYVTLDELPVDVPPAPTSDHPVDRTPKPDLDKTAPVERGMAEQLALYRVAHDLYFRGGSLARATDAFEAYLRAFPNGALSVEARFNEGACLARLGRHPEAVRFLQPFADGLHGEYLRKEAKELLDSMKQR